MGRPRLYQSASERQKAYRERKRNRSVLEPAGKVVEWAASSLVVPAGHPRQGQPFRLAPWQQKIIASCLSNRETCLCVARKNAKSALIAVLVLAHLVGPLKRRGWRAGVLSANRAKAGELLKQCEQIAEASGLKGLKVRRTPWPGKLIADDTGATAEIEGAGYASGHASGYDLAVIDELGLLQERHRPMVAGMRSSVSAKDGRFLSLSIHGDGPFIDEILSRRDAQGLAIHHYVGDPNLPLDDPENWKLANPGMETGIVSRSFLSDEAKRVLDVPSDQAYFRSHHLNLPGNPVGELICSVEAWRRCEVVDLPERKGPCCIGIDLGLTNSFTSAALFWPETNRLEVLTACPSVPSLAVRSRSDGAGALYQTAVGHKVLNVLDGRLTPVRRFLELLCERLAGEPVAAIGCDRYRHAELTQHLADLGLSWRPVWRGAGQRATEDAAADIRAFQRAVEGGTLRTQPNILLTYALGQSHVQRDAQGRAIAIRQARQRARIDCLQASVIALGLGASGKKTRPSKVYVA